MAKQTNVDFLKQNAIKYGTRKIVRVKQRSESALLEKIDRLLTLLDESNEQVTEIQQSINKLTAQDEEQKEQCQKLVVRGNKRIEQTKAKVMAVFRNDMLRYLDIINEIDVRRFRAQMDYEMAEARNEDTAKAGGGTSLLGMLGQGLFAWKMSNAFDDLAKLSGRKK